MPVPMKIVDSRRLAELNQSSIQAGRSRRLPPEQISADPRAKYVVNFRFDHEWKGQRDVRMSVVLRPGVLSAWLDVSPEEYDSIPVVQVSEVEWEAAVCVGIPPWTD